MMNSVNEREIINIIVDSIRKKLLHYKPETSILPFHTRILGKDRMALYSFLQSLNTTFGTTIYEPVAISIANEKFMEKYRGKHAGNTISSDAHIVIQEIMDDLVTGKGTPDKQNEIKRIKSVCRSGRPQTVKLTKIDIYLRSLDTVYMFDIKSAKPNIGEFKGFKRTLLEWTAAQLYIEPSINIVTGIAIPYNPYEPKPYERWAMQGIFDLSKEIFVAEEWWNFLADDFIYDDLLVCFEKTGIILRQEIDDFFAKFN